MHLYVENCKTEKLRNLGGVSKKTQDSKLFVESNEAINRNLDNKDQWKN